MRTYLLLLAFAAALSMHASATDLASESDFAANSDVDPEMYTLKEGEFTVKAQVDILDRDVRMDKSGTVLNIVDLNVSDHALKVRNFIIDEGTLTLRGASAARALHVTDHFIQNGGTVNAYGEVSNANAVMGGYTSVYYMNGGALNAVAGDVHYATSIALQGFVMTGGEAVVQGGGGSQAFGMTGGEFTTLSGGKVSFLGGSGMYGIGLFDTSMLEVSDTAELYAKGGTGTGAFGIQAREVVQTGGVVVAEGGDEAGDNVGIIIGHPMAGSPGYEDLTSYLQKGGTLRAIGGKADDGVGLYLNDEVPSIFAGRVEIERVGTAASIYSAGDLTFTSGSVLSPMISLSQQNTLVSGLIEVDSAATVTIESGVDLVPQLKNTAHLLEEDGEVKLLFIDNSGGFIDGEFNPVETVTLGLRAHKEDDDKYYLTVWRKAEVLELLKPSLPYRNGNDLFKNMYDYLTNGRDCPLGRLWDDLELCTSIRDLYSLASLIAYTTTPHAYADYTHTVMRMADVTDTDFYRQMQKRVSASPALSSVASANGYASLLPYSIRDGANGGLRIWASPMFQQSSRFRNKTEEFGTSKEKFWGGSVGLARDWDRISLGAAAHYIRGDYDSYYSSIDSDNYGARAGILLHSLVPCPEKFNPWLQASIGYDHGRLKQKHYDYVGALRSSRPEINTLRARLELGNSIILGPRFTLTPKIGVDLTYIRQGGYRERGASDYLLRVYHDRHNSLRPRAGLHAAVAVSPKTELSAWGEYVLETQHTHSQFESTFVSFPDVRFTTRGEDRSRSSGNLGAGLRHRMGRVDVQGTYDMTLESRYMAHRFGINVSTSF